MYPVNKRSRRYLLVILTIAVLAFAVQVNADNEDPLVSLSYLNQRLAEVENGNTKGGSAPLKILELKPGQSVIGAEGTEMILRSGKAKAITSENGGLADLTGGKDLPSGSKIPQNHLILLPRSDGRGMKSETKTIIIVRGTHMVE